MAENNFPLALPEKTVLAGQFIIQKVTVWQKERWKHSMNTGYPTALAVM